MIKKIMKELRRNSKWDYGYRIFLMIIIVLFISYFVGMIRG